MKTHFFPPLLILWLALLGPVPAQEQPPRVGDHYQIHQVDLNGDGKPEKVGLNCVEITDNGWYSRLVVWRDGRAVWQSMPAKVGVWAFGGWDWGISDLQWVADVDGDGAVEAIVPEPVSDVSPVSFRVFRWDGQGFRHLKTATLLRVGPNDFAWSGQNRGDCWIGQFKPKGLGVIWTYRDGRANLQEAVLRGNSRGFRVVKWLKRG